MRSEEYVMRWIQAMSSKASVPAPAEARASTATRRVASRALRVSACLFAFAGLLAVEHTAHAQARGARRGGRKVIVIAEQKIEGRIQKPQAFYILQRSNLNFEG